MIPVVIFVCIIHVIISVAVYILMRMNLLRSSQLVTAIVFFVPVWGLVCLLILELKSRLWPGKAKEVGLEKLLVNDEIHRSILMDEDTSTDSVVPLEEALLMNDAQTRRGLMMEVMYADPGDYVGQLQEARMNDDTEVVHYAVTALVELQKGYELEIQKLDRLLAEDPNDDKVLNDYISVMERYLSSGLLDGNARNMQLRNYTDLLARKLERSESPGLWGRKVEAELKLEEYDEAWKGLQILLEGWPQDERGYLFLIQYYAMEKERAGIDDAIRQIREKNVYLSPAGRNVVEFWMGGTGA